jgi:hypothetical protein
MAANARSSCSIVPASSSLFNPVPPCAQWSENSNKALFDVSCQFLPETDGGSSAFDGGNFSYGFLLGRAGSVGQFGLTVDPDIHLYVRLSLLYFRAAFRHLTHVCFFSIYLQANAVDLNTGDEMQLGQASVTSSDSTLFPVSLKVDLKVSSGRCAMCQPNSKRYPCLQAPVFGGRVCVSPIITTHLCSLLCCPSSSSTRLLC